MRLPRVLAALLFAGICIAGINYYMDLGWFGRFGRLAVAAATMLTCLLVIVG
jgi:hypothetical protein